MKIEDFYKLREFDQKAISYIRPATKIILAKTGVKESHVNCFYDMEEKTMRYVIEFKMN